MASETDDHSEDDGGRANSAKWGCGCVGVLILLGVGSTLGSLVFSSYPVAAWGVVVSAVLLVGGGVAGAFVGTYSLEAATRRRMRIGGKVLLGFGLACLLAVIGMTLRSSRFHFEREAAPVSDTLGPIEVPHDNMRMAVRVRQPIEAGAGSRYQRWSFVTIEFLDENKEYLSSFGGEFWHYAGYDGENWEEEDEGYQTTLRMPSAGTYYIRLQTEANVDPSELGPVSFEMYERAWWGNPLPIRIAAYLAFFFGGLLVVAPRMGRSQRLVNHLKDGGRVRYDGQTWRVENPLHCEYDDWVADEWTLQPTDPGTRMPRYLEHEYETDGNWENWLISRPVESETLRCTGPRGEEMTVQQYASTHGEWPDAVTVEGTQYTLEDSGTVRREGASVAYHNYKDDQTGFVTIEGEPPDALDAAIGESTSVSELSIGGEDDASAAA